jgi:hypothetical protein
MRTTLVAIALVAVSSPAVTGDDESGPPARFPIQNGSGSGYLDADAKPVTAFQYGHAGEFSQGAACVSRAGKYFFIDTDGKPLGKLKFDGCGDFADGLARVVTKAGPAYVNLRGKVMVTPAWKKQRAEEAGDFADGLAAVRIGARWGYIDTKGGWVVEPRFGPDLDWKAYKAKLKAAARDPEALAELQASVDFTAAARFAGGRAAVKVGDKWGYIDTSGKLVIEPQWAAQPAPFAEGLAAVPVGERAHAYVDPSGKVAIAGPFEAAGRFSEGLAAVRTADGWRYIDARGAVVITLEPGIVQAGEFHDGLAAVAKKLELRGYIDPKGAWAIAPAFTSAGDFRRGRAPVSKNPTPAWIDRTGAPLWISDDPAGTWKDHAQREFK